MLQCKGYVEERLWNGYECKKVEKIDNPLTTLLPSN